jgi:hypothetical protein
MGEALSKSRPDIQDRISRRRMIKRLGAATAVVWTAPVLSTLGGTPAFAQYLCPSCPPLGSSGSEHCANQPDCGADPTGNPCCCIRSAEDTCECHSCIMCSSPALTPCASSRDCPPGWICGISCCSDPAAVDDFLCLPRCGAGDNPAPCVATGGRRVTIGQTSMG